jgi:ABC transport system ATP-binding/permease protein
VLDQRLAELEGIADDRVSDVVGRYRTSYAVGGADLTPGQLLERLGFPSAQLSSRVKDLSGGQRRRLQLLLVLLDEPNVLILDEPTNDLDTDMLAALEDLLDSWPGTLLVVSHDRYLLERVTDQQYGILDARLRHLPGGVDEYLRLRRDAPAGTGAGPARPAGASTAAAAPSAPALGGAERRAAEKELAALDRRLAKLGEQIAAQHAAFADADQSDYALLARMQDDLGALERETAAAEERWLELSDLLEG